MGTDTSKDAGTGDDVFTGVSWDLLIRELFWGISLLWVYLVRETEKQMTTTGWVIFEDNSLMTWLLDHESVDVDLLYY